MVDIGVPEDVVAVAPVVAAVVGVVLVAAGVEDAT
jgi:hypothetical protein